MQDILSGSDGLHRVVKVSKMDSLLLNIRMGNYPHCYEKLYQRYDEISAIKIKINFKKPLLEDSFYFEKFEVFVVFFGKNSEVLNRELFFLSESKFR